MQHSVHGNTLTIVFSDVLNQNSLEKEDINVFLHHKSLQVKQMLFSDHNRDIHLTFTEAISENGLVVQFNRLPVSAGGIPATLWAAHPMFRMTN